MHIPPLELKNLVDVNCPLCGNCSPKRITQKGQFSLTCNVSICENDGLVYLTPRWSKPKYNQFYREEYDNYYRSSRSKEDEKKVHSKCIELIMQRLSSIQVGQAQKSVLDIGAGMGYSLSWLKENYKNFEVYAAIEPSSECKKNIESSDFIQYITDDLDSNWDAGKFDLIILRHVLEHFMSPISSLKKVAQHMKNDSFAYIAVPDMMNPKGELENYWFRTVHTFYFSKETLVKSANMAGLEAVIIGQENSELWGVFKLSNKKPIEFNEKNTYKRQMTVINKHLNKRKIKDTTSIV
ncbi:class I SAM-dependent methyltransferase [Bowmanella pacifica]|uniref:Class I SAM-dependent methyltransferase n=1 Tax=Bowmanella pacifica TaxID=502051 RepID=A0A917Z364_9ALTE|nr:class I SAM-dependent methyltransferase [Bowmanella pacifica]GGO73854.1 hypothetical protein GCM10010982_35350 [Bowmanella pacifica]